MMSLIHHGAVASYAASPPSLTYICKPLRVSAGPSPGHTLLRLLCEPVNSMSVEFLAPYTPNEEEKKDAGLFASNVRALMARQLGVPVTNHSFDEVLLQKEALSLEMPPDMAVDGLELKTVNEVFNVDMTLDKVKEHLHRFKQMDKRGKGKIIHYISQKAVQQALI